MYNMKKSPLKQLGNQMQGQMKDQQHVEKGMMEAGMDILGENQRRKNWEQTQLNIEDLEPDVMQVRKHRDKKLREDHGRLVETGLGTALPKKYANAFLTHVKMIQEEYHAALTVNNLEKQAEIKTRSATLKNYVSAIKDEMEGFIDYHFGEKYLASKGVSQQQISFATQMYCNNEDLIVTLATQDDVLFGQKDYYGDLVKADHFYAIVQDFYGNMVLVDVLQGNRDVFMTDIMVATEYMTFVNKLAEEAKEARKAKSAVEINLEKINHKMNNLFGLNDGTATKKQDQIVLTFAHDDAVLPDVNTFKRHLYEHPNIKNLNYGGFDFYKLEHIADLGPGDKNFWHDNIDELDRIRLVDAICNQDGPFFDMDLLRTLVKEYYTIIAENAWWKSMGFDKGRLDLMRLKQKELIKERFKMEKAKAAQEGRLEFLFDGKVYRTGMTPAKVKQQEDDRGKLLQ